MSLLPSKYVNQVCHSFDGMVSEYGHRIVASESKFRLHARGIYCLVVTLVSLSTAAVPAGRCTRASTRRARVTYSDHVPADATQITVIRVTPNSAGPSAIGGAGGVTSSTVPSNSGPVGARTATDAQTSNTVSPPKQSSSAGGVGAAGGAAGASTAGGAPTAGGGATSAAPFAARPAAIPGARPVPGIVSTPTTPTPTSGAEPESAAEASAPEATSGAELSPTVPQPNRSVAVVEQGFKVGVGMHWGPAKRNVDGIFNVLKTLAVTETQHHLYWRWFEVDKGTLAIDPTFASLVELPSASEG